MTKLDSTTPAIGAIGLVRIKGGVGTLIRIGQWLAGGGFADYQHAFICVNIQDDIVYAVEAMPDGAQLGTYKTNDNIYWLHLPITDSERTQIVDAANKYIGTPYSFIDYLALALHKFHIPAPRLKDYIASTGHMICSQLVDQCYWDANVHLFDDHRWPGYVMPLDIYNLHPHIYKIPQLKRSHK